MKGFKATDPHSSGVVVTKCYGSRQFFSQSTQRCKINITTYFS